MTQKPKIQYVGQFYVYGSEAQALQPDAPKKPRTQLPEAVRKRMEKVYVDPVALMALVAAVFVLVAMITGVKQLQRDWEEYSTVAQYLHELKETNHEKTEAFRETYVRSEIRAKAESMGMIPKAEAQRSTVTVTIPQPEPEETLLDTIKWFVKGLFA